MGKRRFWAHIEGDARRNPATGHSTRIDSHTRGWDLGIQVVGYVDGHGKDAFDIHVTGGSNNPTRTRLVLTVRETEQEMVVVENEDCHYLWNRQLKTPGEHSFV